MSKTIKNIAVSLLLAAIVVVSLGVGCALGTRTSPEQGLGIVEQAWNIILEDYVDKERLDTGTLSQGAIKGMVEALDDPYTSYLDAETYQLSLGNLEGKFEGIGAHVAAKDGQLVIIAPIADSPADRAGIRAGDIILEIDGRSTSGMSLAEAVLIIRGPEGTTVALLVLHQGETEPEVIEIVRAEIELPSVRFEMRGDIAYINITYFSERTDEELSLALESVAQQVAVGIILDLRGNAGGLLETVIDVAGFFLKEGVVVDVVDNEGKHTASSVKPSQIATDLPLVVLVDGYSASGSEVLVGALQDHARATIAGTRTYGKGSVNILRQLKDGSGLYITTARWLTPKGRLIEGEGLYPDYELELEGEDAIQWAIDFLKSSECH
ncbi:MAG: S41 family peptidase [Dehalococcoidales bacterium]|nr:S41 family peptidase [Dehalococcoidales bacterium]